MLPEYPASVAISLDLRACLHPLFQQVITGISEHTFANIYLFRDEHSYRLSRLPNNLPIILGQDDGRRFFMLPFGIPEKEILDRLFRDYERLKCAPRQQAEILAQQGYIMEEDRDNFDYLHARQDLATLAGRRFHKKRNRVKGFVTSFQCQAQPIDNSCLADAMAALDRWRDNAEAAEGSEETDSAGDYTEARDALEHREILGLRGRVYFIAGQPVGYAMGEELPDHKTFVVHFEKADIAYNGLYQFINQDFAAALPDNIATINREQDLGVPGLRQAKLSYHPSGFIEKFTVTPAA
ncbi:MAG TPA: ABC transporter permease [Desulfobulbaceae bacterium]|nr:ABC transporter permease [Desulfobulbaceae bacterium]